MESATNPMVIEFEQLKYFADVSTTKKDNAYNKMMECFHIIKKFKGDDKYKQMLA